ncbi:MAG TPA: galactose oxidase-like domain-containing protein, partial [Candidatus Binatia bacterium]|nr:galactose oxidase-like domain-containing protein [Candidatus Binatia bacterium]
GATDAGAVYTFDTSFWNPGTLLLTIANPTPAVLDRFGVALTTVGVPGGTNLLVGTPYDDGAGTDAGAVYVFNLATGALLATIQRPGAVAGDLFGYALGSIGEAVIGAPLADVGATDSGAVYVFDNTSPYALLATINNPTAAAADNFGAAVASGCKLVATASGDDTLATNAGAAYLYERTMAACWTSGTGAQIGSWATAASWPAIAIHSTVLHTGNKGKVLFFQGSDPTSTTPTYTWDADLGTVAQQGNAEMDTFCAGHTTLSDGRAISVGGHAELTFANGIPVNDIFDPATGAWTRKADMAYSRWYPTATALGDGRVMVTSGWESGANPSNIPEVYDVGNNCWRSLSLNSVIHLANYPAMFLLPSGKLFQANGDANGGVNRMTRTLTVPAAGACADPANGTWTDVGLAPFNGLAGSAVLYQVSESGGVATAAKVLKSGGENPVLTSAATIDMMAGTPTWASTTAMNAARRNHNLTVLPDGKVLAIGGSSSNDGAEEIDGAVQGAEMWDPGTGAWTRMACISDPRMYHSTAVLLPDARVLSAGGNCFPSYQIYSPPYLFGGTRPTITSAPVDAVYNTSFNVGVSSPASAITSVVFIRPSSVTHAFDQNQRRVTAQFSVVDSTTLSVKAPLNNFVAPRGYYMMFVLANGVPSVARFVNLKDGGCP